MMKMLPNFHSILTTILFIGLYSTSGFADDTSMRTWTRKDGKTATGELVEINGKTASIKMKNGKHGELKINELSLNDQQYVKDWTPNPPKRPSYIPKGAHFQNGKWFLVVNDKLTWKKAEQKARKMRGQLAKFESELEIELLENFAIKKNYFWIGATDEDEEGVWKWSDGSPVKSTNWDSGQPSNEGKREHFASVRPGGKWNDVRGDSSSITGFIVQWEHRK